MVVVQPAKKEELAASGGHKAIQFCHCDLTSTWTDLTCTPSLAAESSSSAYKKGSGQSLFWSIFSWPQSGNPQLLG
jgi:hypothetical protein